MRFLFYYLIDARPHAKEMFVSGFAFGGSSEVQTQGVKECSYQQLSKRCWKRLVGNEKTDSQDDKRNFLNRILVQKM